ncbi:MAG: hypothetical protein NC093_09395 [Alistipes sp.]|nr:hypothetical protein [Alistipes sp.]
MTIYKGRCMLALKNILLIVLVMIFLFIILSGVTIIVGSGNIQIKIFKNNKSSFRSVALSALDKVNSNSTYNTESILDELPKSCNVDSVRVYTGVNGEKYVYFSFYNRAGYPSTEKKYRVIAFNSNNVVPSELEGEHIRKIEDNWYYIDNVKRHTSIAVLFSMIIIEIMLVFVYFRLFRKKKNK